MDGMTSWENKAVAESKAGDEQGKNSTNGLLECRVHDQVMKGPGSMSVQVHVLAPCVKVLAPCVWYQFTGAQGQI